MKKIAIAVMFVALSSPYAMAQNTTLTAALVATYKNNPQLAQARANLLRVDENIATARAGTLPRVNADYTLRATEGSGLDSLSDTAALNISQTLWDNGQTRAAVEAARFGVLSARQQTLEIEQNVLRSAIVAYMDLRAARANLDLTNNNIKLLQEQLRAANDRFEVGEITKTDVSLTESRLATARSGAAAAQANLAGIAANYTALTGLKPTPLSTTVNLPKIPAKLSQAEATALENHPSIKAAELNVQAASLDIALQDKNKSPTLSASVGASANRSGTGIGDGFAQSSEGINLTVQLNMPIFQGGILASQRRQAKAQHATQVAALDLARVNTLATLRAGYARYRAAQASKEAAIEGIRAAEIAYDGVNEEAKLGARTTLDVLNAEQELLGARAELVNSIRDEQVAAYDVIAEMGQLTAEALNLPVELYDPTAQAEAQKEAAKAKSPLGLKRLNLLEKLRARN